MAHPTKPRAAAELYNYPADMRYNIVKTDKNRKQG